MRTSPFLCCSGSPVGTSVFVCACVWRQRSTPCWPEAAVSPAVSHMDPSTGALLLYSHSSASPALYSEVTLWGRFVAIAAIIAIIWLSATNLSQCNSPAGPISGAGLCLICILRQSGAAGVSLLSRDGGLRWWFFSNDFISAVSESQFDHHEWEYSARLDACSCWRPTLVPFCSFE